MHTPSHNVTPSAVNLNETPNQPNVIMHLPSDTPTSGLLNTQETSSLFSNRIGPNQRVEQSSFDLNASLADRIDLHMCNRETTIIEESKDTRKTKSKQQENKYVSAL